MRLSEEGPLHTLKGTHSLIFGNSKIFGFCLFACFVLVIFVLFFVLYIRLAVLELNM